MKDSHLKTPRTMRDAFGDDTRLTTGSQPDSAWAYVAACALAVAMVWLLCWRG